MFVVSRNETFKLLIIRLQRVIVMPLIPVAELVNSGYCCFAAMAFAYLHQSIAQRKLDLIALKQIIDSLARSLMLIAAGQPRTQDIPFRPKANETTTLKVDSFSHFSSPPRAVFRFLRFGFGPLG